MAQDMFSGSGAPSAALGISPAGSDARKTAQLRLLLSPRSPSAGSGSGSLGVAQDDRGREYLFAALKSRSSTKPAGHEWPLFAYINHFFLLTMSQAIQRARQKKRPPVFAASLSA